MSKFAFLSDEWLGAVLALQEEYRDKVPGAVVSMRMNQIITDVPFGEGTVHLSTDTSSGKGVMGRGHLENADVTLTTDYATAKQLIANNDQQAAMQAFMQGKIKAVGDMAKIMTPPPPKNDAQKEIEEKIKGLTE